MADSLPYKRGRHVVICQQSGRAFYDNEVVRQYDGLIVGREYADPQHPQELIRIRPERAVKMPLNPPAPDDVFIPLQAFGYDYGAHWNFTPDLPADLITNYTYDSPANDPVTGTADSFFMTTGDAKWYRNSDGLLAQGIANSMVREFDTNGNCLGWLLEPATKTNRILRSRDWGNLAVWGPFNSDVIASLVPVPYASGTTKFQKLVERVGSAVHRTRQTAAGLTAGATATASCLAKAGERTIIAIRVLDSLGSDGAQAKFDLVSGIATVTTTFGAGTVISAYMEPFAYGSWRCFLTVKPNAVTTSYIVDYFLLDASGATTYLGDGASGAYFADAQIEEGPVGTTIIPTLGAAVTRSADRANLTLGSWFSQTAGTVYAKCRLGIGNKGSNQFIASFNDGTNANYNVLYSSNTGLGSLVINKASGFGGTSQVGALPDRTNFRLIGAWSANNIRAAKNGTLGNLDSSGAIPTALTRLDIGCHEDSLQACHSLWLQTLDLWPERKVDADIASRSLAA